MALVANRYQNEQDLLWLLTTLRSAMQRLAKHVLISPNEWALHDAALAAAQQLDLPAFEIALNDLDSRIHFHGHAQLGLVAAAKYRLVRHLILAIHDVWPEFFAGR